jgi:hypothetical protein
LKDLTAGDKDYELIVGRLTQLEALIQARAEMIVAETPAKRLAVQEKLDRARIALFEPFGCQL